MKWEVQPDRISHAAGCLLMSLLFVLCYACSGKPAREEEKVTVVFPELDSLYNKVKRLHEYQQYQGNFLFDTRQGVQWAAINKNDSMLSKFYVLISNYYLYGKNLNHDSTKYYVEFAEKHADLSSNDRVLIDALASKASYFYLAQQNYDSAIALYKRILQIAEKERVINAIPELTVNHALAGLYEETEQFDTAWKYYNIVLEGTLSIEKNKQDTQTKDPHWVRYLHITVVHDIAGLLVKQNDYVKALAYYQELDHLLPDKRKQFYPTLYTGKAVCYEGLNRIDSAIKYYKLGIANFKNDHFNITPNPEPYLRYGKLLVRRGQIKEGEKYLQDASRVTWGQPNREDKYILETQLALGEYYISQGKWIQAIDTLQTALRLAKELKKTKSQAIIYKNLSQLNERRNDYKTALDYSKLFREYDDSLKAESFAKQTSEMDAKYRAHENTQQIILLQKDNRIQQLRLQATRRARVFYIAGAIALLSIGGIMYYYRARQQHIQHNKVKAELENKALRAQMNPHFIFNSLNAIQELIVTENYPSSYEYLSKFSRLLRMVLHNSEKKFILLTQEIEMYHLYLELESLRFKHAFNYTITVSPGIDTDNILFPTLLMQPVIENALWHGLSPKQGEKSLNISFEELQGVLSCIITDNGIGREKAMKIKASKISTGHFESKGISLVQQRIRTLKSELGEYASFDIIDCKDPTGTACGTKVKVQVSVMENI